MAFFTQRMVAMCRALPPAFKPRSSLLQLPGRDTGRGTAISKVRVIGKDPTQDFHKEAQTDCEVQLGTADMLNYEVQADTSTWGAIQ